MELYNGNIIDPIHGLIRLSDIEKWFMSKKQFSRLRWIKQNTFVYYVFPSANHTRFEHSIGVMYLASEILRNVVINFNAGSYRRRKHDININKKEFEFLDIDSEYANDSNKGKKSIHLQELRLAALLHDIGHGPLSHKFDSYTITKQKFLSIVSTNDLSKKYLSEFDALLTTLGDDDKIEHEHISCLFILQLVNALKMENENNPDKFFDELNEMIKSISGERIVRLVEPKLDFGDAGKMIVNQSDLTPFYSSIISSFPIDADRMDYLLRDGTFTGVKYGVYDLSRLFTSLVPVKVKDVGYLAVKESGVDACVRFIESRTHLFNIVYPHKTNISATVMLDYIFDEFNKPIIEANDFDELVDFYWKNSDEFFIKSTIVEQVIKPISNRQVRDNKIEVHEQLLRRRMWKKIFEFRFVIKTESNELDKKFKQREKELKEIVEKINLKLKKLPEMASLANLFINKVFKDLEKSKLYIVKKKQNEYELIKTWKGFNAEVNSMDYKVGFFKIFLERKFKSSSHFLETQNKILDLIREELEEFKNLANAPL